MKNLFLGLLLAGALVLPLSGVAHAINTTNGSFETGDMTGWSTTADQTIPSVITSFTSSGGEINYSATDGSYFAKLTATASIFQSQTWNSGDEISFDWAFSAQDYMPFNDTAWFNPGDGSGPINLSSVASVGYYGETDWASYTYIYSSAGTGNISWGVSNGIDNAFDSVLLVDNVTTPNQTIPNPEPATVTLLGIGLVGLAGGVVRKKLKTKAV